MIAGFGEIMDESIENVYGLDGLDALEVEIGELGRTRTMYSIIRKYLIDIYGQAAYKDSAEWKRLHDLEVLFKTKVEHHLVRQHRSQVNQLLNDLYLQIRQKVQSKGNLKGVDKGDQLLGDLGKWKLFDKDRKNLRKQLKTKYGKNWRKSKEWQDYQKQNGLKLTDFTRTLTDNTELQSKMPIALQAELKKAQDAGMNPDAEYADMKTKGLIETPPGEGILKKAWDLARNNPVPAIAIAVAGLYALVPPVRNEVNAMLGIGAKKHSGSGEKLKGLKEEKLS